MYFNQGCHKVTRQSPSVKLYLTLNIGIVKHIKTDKKIILGFPKSRNPNNLAEGKVINGGVPSE